MHAYTDKLFCAINGLVQPDPFYTGCLLKLEIISARSERVWYSSQIRHVLPARSCWYAELFVNVIFTIRM